MMSPAPLPTDPALCEWSRPRVYAFAAGIAAAATVVLPGAARAQSTGYSIELRAGAFGSTPLVEDAVVHPVALDSLLNGDHTATAIEVGPEAAPFLELAGMIHLSADWGIEAAAGWTFSELAASSGGTDREIESLGVGHAVASLRRRIGESYHARAGIGAIRYYAEDSGLFAEGSGTEFLIAAGMGALWPVGPLNVGVELVGQMHRFGTVALRRAGGLDGVVYRFGLAGRVSYGGGGS